MFHFVLRVGKDEDEDEGKCVGSSFEWTVEEFRVVINPPFIEDIINNYVDDMMSITIAKTFIESVEVENHGFICAEKVVVEEFLWVYFCSFGLKSKNLISAKKFEKSFKNTIFNFRHRQKKFAKQILPLKIIFAL